MMNFSLLIVNFHYFREEKPASGIYPISSSEFLIQLDELAKQYTFCSQADIIRWILTDKYPDGHFCLITFDDGLAEQMAAWEILMKKGIPAIFFVPVAPMQGHMVLSVHQLQHVRSVLADQELYNFLAEETNINMFNFDEDRLKDQYHYDTDLARKIKFYLNFVLAEHDRTKVMRKIFRTVAGDEKDFSKEFYMSEANLIKLAASDMLGSHGTDHQPLAVLPVECAKADVLNSLEYLKKMTGREIASFSYPYGGSTAVVSNADHLFADTSVQFALTMKRGINTSNDVQERFYLKRIDTNDAPGGKSPLSSFSSR